MLNYNRTVHCTVIMFKKILSLSKKLIAIKSVADNPAGLEQALQVVLAELPEFTIEKFERAGIKSALVYTTKTRPKKFRLLFNVHLDVIPAKDNQFRPKIVGDKLFGAGSMDMKANAACSIYAFKELAKTVEYPIGLQLVTDEEIGGANGTSYQVEKGVRADFVVATEPTNFEIVHKAKGVCQIKIAAKGLTAHGAYPWRGDNAIEKMHEYVSVLKKVLINPKKEQWLTTVNISKIETTNNAFNKIPDDCTIWLDIRYIAEDSKTILKKIKKTLPKDFALELVNFSPDVSTKKEDKNIVLLEKITKSVTGNKAILRGANGTSDLSHFAKVNSFGIEFGPVGGGIGSDEEWVSVSSLKDYFQILQEFIKSTK